MQGLLTDAEQHALHDPSGHAEALTLCGTARLAAGDVFGAFMFADRRCRVATPQPHDLLLRGEALRRLGFAAAARADLDRAATVDAVDPLVLRRLIDAGDAASDAAAAWVLGDPRAPDALVAHAAAHLAWSGTRVLGSLTIDDGGLTGWLSWRGGEYALRVETGAGAMTWRLPRRDETAVFAPVPITARLPAPFVALSLTSEGAPLAATHVAVRVNPSVAPAAPRARTARATPPEDLVTAVVPVYDDVDVTRDCLTALAAQHTGTLTLSVIVVDDAAPAPAMKAMLEALCARHGFELLVNERNLGFIGTVNRALAAIPGGDVLLLNADVVMPPTAVARLAAVARSRPEIGLVNPLTNNGQFNSFPALFGDNAFGDAATIAAIDAQAERVGASPVETPGGIGYCLYVTRACLDAVGDLSEVYWRGYYEDVEFCLRAREHGFLSVCAPSVYVGHKGSVSFKGEKLRLVARNERVNEARFPAHPPHCRAFRRADPLREARGAIEALAFPMAPVDVIVAGGAPHAAAVRARAATLGDAAGLMLIWSAANGSPTAELHRFGAPEPRQKRYPLPERADALVDDLLALHPGRAELAGPAGPLAPVLAALRRRGLAVDAMPSGPVADAMDVVAPENVVADPALLERAPGSAPAVPRTRRVLVAILCPQPDLAAERWLVTLLAAARRDRPAWGFVLLGAALDASRLMAAGNAFATGRVDEDEEADLVVHYGASALLAPRRCGGHGRLAVLGHTLGLPKAFFDGSPGGNPIPTVDLALDPRVADPEAAGAVCRWLGGLPVSPA